MKWLSFRLSYFAAKEAAEKKEWEKAQAHFNKALQISPFHAEAMLGLAEVTWNLGKKEEARGLVARFLEREPGVGSAYFLLGKFYQDEKDYSKALNHLLKAAKLEPNNEEVWYELGKIYLQLKQEGMALAAFSEVTCMDPFIVPYQLSLLQEKVASKGNTNSP